LYAYTSPPSHLRFGSLTKKLFVKNTTLNKPYVTREKFHVNIHINKYQTNTYTNIIYKTTNNIYLPKKKYHIPYKTDIEHIHSINIMYTNTIYKHKYQTYIVFLGCIIYIYGVYYTIL